MLSLYKLEIFNTVAMEGSFSRAAEKLLLSQPAVSQHIKDLEASVRAELFKRGNRGVVLTEAGETLLDYTRCILRMLAEAENAIRTIQDLPEVVLTLGASPGVGIYLLPSWIQPFRDRYPKAMIRVKTDTTSAVVREVQAGRLDIAFVEGELELSPQIATLTLTEIELFLMAGLNHPWASRASVSMEDLEGEPFITRPAGSQTRTWLDNLFAEQGIVVNIVAEFDRPEAIMAAVASGMGVTILPAWSEAEGSHSGLRALRIKGRKMFRTVKLVWSEEHPIKPVARAFLAGMVDQFPQMTKLVSEMNPLPINIPDRGIYKASLSCKGTRISESESGSRVKTRESPY